MKAQIDAFGIWFLVLMLVTLPIAVIRAARTEKPAVVSRQRISQRLKTVFALVVLAAMALGVAWRDHIELFPPIQVTGKLVALSIVILLGTIALAEALLQSRSPEERRELWVRQIIPQNNAERFVWLISSTVAGVRGSVGKRKCVGIQVILGDRTSRAKRSLILGKNRSPESGPTGREKQPRAEAGGRRPGSGSPTNHAA